MKLQCPAPDRAAEAAARARQAELTKPPGSLGRLEEIAVQLAAWQGQALPDATAACVLFAADHPVTRHGISPYPSAVTRAMLQNFVAGGAAASVLCGLRGVPLTVVDVGVEGAPLQADASQAVRFVRAPVAALPAGDLRVEDAMSEAVFQGCLDAGRRAVAALPPDVRVLIVGDMGIGNSTVAACLCAALAGGDPEQWVGRGTGADAAMVQTKVAVCRDALLRLAPSDGPLERLRRVGGRELAAMFAAMATAIERRMTVLVDGFIASSAALALCKHAPGALPGLLWAHRSAERGHAALLAHLDVTPLVDLDLRLGEGSGALIAYPLLESACALHARMATFESAAVPERDR